MSQKEKLIKKLLNKPKDFTVQDADSLLSKCGFIIDNKGKTSGSAAKYFNPDKGINILMHRPHPGNLLKPYQIKKIINKLIEAGELSEK